MVSFFAGRHAGEHVSNSRVSPAAVCAYFKRAVTLFHLFGKLPLEHEAGFDDAPCLVGVGPADSETNRRAGDEVSEVNDRDVSSKEEGILDPGRGHSE